MRALLIAIESLGVGQIADHPVPNTLAQLFREVPELELPNLFALGLGEILKGRVFDPPARKCIASYGRMAQRSAGPDLISGLWEMAGVISRQPFAPASALPHDAVATLARECRVEFLFAPAATGPLPPEVLDEHRRTGHPVLSQGPASTLCVWADEKAFPAPRFAQLCRSVRRVANWWHIARVEGRRPAKPGSAAVHLPAVPPRTLLNAIADRGLAVETVGLIREAFAHSGVTRSHPAGAVADTLKIIERLWRMPQTGLLFAHLAPFAGATPQDHAAALGQLDEWVPGFLEEVDTDSLVILAGTHAASLLEPSAPREETPVLLRYGGRTLPLGMRESFSDVAATLAAFFGIQEPDAPWVNGSPLITFQRPKGFGGPWGS